MGHRQRHQPRCAQARRFRHLRARVARRHGPYEYHAHRLGDGGSGLAGRVRLVWLRNTDDDDDERWAVVDD